MIDAPSSSAAAYEAVRARLRSAVLAGSPLAEVVDTWLLRQPLPPTVLVPIAAAGHVGRASTALGASLGLLVLSVRWLDDLLDDDREGQLHDRLGAGRAALLASSALSHAWAVLASEPAVPREVLAGFGDTCAVLAIGEHDDVVAPPGDLGAWRRIAWRKTGVAWRFAAWSGAMTTGAAPWVAAAAQLGGHLGMHLQAEDDIAGVYTGDHPDLRRGATCPLPVVLLVADDPAAADLWRRRDVERLMACLEARGIRQRCEEISLGHAAAAAQALRSTPGPWQTACEGLLSALTTG